MQWNGRGGTRPTALNADLWKNKTGSWADISLLLISALRSVDIRAFPMAVGSRNNIKMNEEYPILDDYVGLDVVAVLDDDSKVVLDPSDKYLPFGEADIEQLNTQGLIFLDPDRHIWLPIEDKLDNTKKITIQATFDESGKVSGTMRMVYSNHSGEYMLKSRKADNQAAVTEYLKREIPTATVESVSDSTAGFSFIYKVRFSAQAVTDNDGNVYISMSNVYGEVTNPFINKERKADVEFGYKTKTDVTMLIQLPDGYTADPVPAAASIGMKDTSATFVSDAQVRERTVTLHQQLDYRRSTYRVADYPAFFDFEKKYYDLRQKPVVIRKKS